MKIEERIKQRAAENVRVRITAQKRSKAGFRITAWDGTDKVFPNRKTALQFLLAIVRCSPRQSFTLKPNGGEPTAEEAFEMGKWMGMKKGGS